MDRFERDISVTLIFLESSQLVSTINYPLSLYCNIEDTTQSRKSSARTYFKSFPRDTQINGSRNSVANCPYEGKFENRKFMQTNRTLASLKLSTIPNNRPTLHYRYTPYNPLSPLHVWTRLLWFKF